MNFYIQYRIPLKVIPSNLNYLFRTYQNIEFDYVRNMVILYSLQSFDVRFDLQTLNEFRVNIFVMPIHYCLSFIPYLHP